MIRNTPRNDCFGLAITTEIRAMDETNVKIIVAISFQTELQLILSARGLPYEKGGENDLRFPSKNTLLLTTVPAQGLGLPRQDSVYILGGLSMGSQHN